MRAPAEICSSSAACTRVWHWSQARMREASSREQVLQLRAMATGRVDTGARVLGASVGFRRGGLTEWSQNVQFSSGSKFPGDADTYKENDQTNGAVQRILQLEEWRSEPRQREHPDRRSDAHLWFWSGGLRRDR